MDYSRVGGVWFLIIVIVAVLPMNVWAQTPQSLTGSDIKLNEKATGGTTATINEKLLSKVSGQGAAISPEKLMERNKDLKPIKGSESAAGSKGDQSQAASETKSQRPQAVTIKANPQPIVASKVPVAVKQSTSPSPQIASASENKSASAKNKIVSTTTTSRVETAPNNNTKQVQITPSNLTSNQSKNYSPVVATSPMIVTSGAIIPLNMTENLTLAENVSRRTENVSKTPTELAIETEPGTDRIWREGISPAEYTWTPQTFSGFFYDLDDNVGTEKLSVKLQKSGEHYDRSIDSGNVQYKSDVQDIDYEFSDWGSYQVMGFMADKYFAGYKESEIIDRPRSLINEGQLRRVLIDSDTENTLTSGSVMQLEEGYELRIKEVDINGNKIFLSLAKNGQEVDSKVVSPDNLKSATYKYEVDVAGEKTPIVMAHISNVFASAESNLATIDGLFQISDTYASVEDGDKYDKMKVTSVSDAGVEMENEDSLTLRRGGTVRIFGNVGFEVADADELRFAPNVERVGTYDVRGTVINPSDTSDFIWTPYNFEGFYYDIDDDVGTESLDAKITSGTKIEEKDLTYKTSPQPVKFKFEDWGKYNVIGFMADKYFAGYNNATRFTDEASAINEGQLRRVLIDSDDSQTIASGSVFPLAEGYELRIKEVDINGNKVFLGLAKDGNEVDSKVVTPSSNAADRASNYMYKIDMGSVKDVPIIAAHIQNVFRGTETDLATIDGIFQVSDSAESVEEGEVHGKMKVETLGDDGITMKNDGAISLGRGRTIDIMENLRLEIADNTMRLIAPIATKTGTGKALTLNIPDAIVNNKITIGVKSGTEALSGVQLLLNGSTIGVTDISGSFDYTPKNLGSFDVVAKKTGYNDAKGTLIVRTAAAAAAHAANLTMNNQVIINAPLEVTKGEPFLITVVKGVNQTPVEGARIFIDNTSVGNTSAQGTFTYIFNNASEHIIRVEINGSNQTIRKISVASPIKIQDLKFPEKVSAGQDIKIVANVYNTGKDPEYRKMELRINDKIMSSKNVSLKPGENSTATFSYRPREPGTYRLSLDGKSTTLNVEKSQNRNWLIALIIVLLIIIGAGFYLYRTGELEKLKRQLQNR